MVPYMTKPALMEKVVQRNKTVFQTTNRSWVPERWPIKRSGTSRNELPATNEQLVLSCALVFLISDVRTST